MSLNIPSEAALKTLNDAILDEEDVSVLQEHLKNEPVSLKDSLWDGMTPLSRAVLTNHIPAAELLISSGASLNTSVRMFDDQKRVWRYESPLVSAARLGRIHIVTLLSKASAEIDIPDSSLGKTALNWACTRKHTDVAKYLITQGAQVDKGDYFSETPMTEAIGNRNFELVRMLVDHGVLLDVHVNYDRDTALLFALLIHETAMSQLLIQAGANVNVMNRNGDDCMAAVITSGYFNDLHVAAKMCALLICAGYKVQDKHVKQAKFMENGSCVSVIEGVLSGPRSLLDSCRLLVRRRLLQRSSNTSILSFADRLPLPSRLRQFVKLEI